MPNCQCNFFSFYAKLSGEKNQFGTICAYRYSVHLLFNPLIPMTMENKFEGLLSESEMNEIQNLLQNKDIYELVMMRRGTIQICADIEYHFGIFGVNYFLISLDKEIEKRNAYDLEKCEFYDVVDSTLYKNKEKKYRLEQQRKSELEFLAGLCRYLETH